MQSGDFRVTYASDERIFETRLPIVALVGLLAALAAVPLVAGTYWLDVLNRIGIAIIGAIGLNILVGFTGQISIGHAAGTPPSSPWARTARPSSKPRPGSRSGWRSRSPPR